MRTFLHNIRRYRFLTLTVLLITLFVCAAPLLSHAQAAANTAAAADPLKVPITCAKDWSFMSALACFARMIMAAIGAFFVYIGTWILAVAGLFFNFLVENTVIAFQPAIYGKIQAPLEAAWAVFRDLANILIVGMFVFIAINIILDTQQFGRKQLVVNVIIIAVLINFSLLFTKLAIDTSNFVSYQFYQAAVAPYGPQNQDNAGVAGPNGDYLFGANVGIAGHFLDFMGVTSLGDTAGALSRTGHDDITGPFAPLLHGLVSSILLVGAAAVFMYGTALLFARAVIILLLLLFSSIAFASFLIPGSTRKIFDTWIAELIGVSVFAPVLMLMLWATLKMADALGQSSGTLGTLMSDPSRNGSYDALFAYILILGLLYATFYTASNVAGKSKGLGTAGLKTVAEFGGGFIARNTIGRGAVFMQGRFEQRRDARTQQAARAHNDLQLLEASGQGKSLKAFQKQLSAGLATFRAANNQSAVDRLGKVSGYKFGGQSFTGVMDKRAKDAEAFAKKMKISDDDAKKMRETAANAAIESHKQQKEVLETTKKAAEETVKSVQEAAKSSADHVNIQATKQIEESRAQQLENDQKAAEAAHQKNLSKLREEAARATDPQAVASKREEMAKEEIARETARKAEAKKIEEARQRVVDLQKQYSELKVTAAQKNADGSTTNIVTTLKDALAQQADAQQKLAEHLKIKPDTVGKEARKDVDKAMAATMQQIGNIAGRRSGTIPDRVVGFFMGDNTAVGEKMKKKFKYVEKSEKDKFFEEFKKVQKEMGGDGEAKEAGKKEGKK